MRYRHQILSLLALTAIVAVAGFVALRPAGPTTTHAGSETIVVDDIWFCDSSFHNGICETTVDVGTTVSWDFDPASLPHTTTHCGDNCNSPTGSPLWDSGTRNGGTFEYTFDTPGTFLYLCNIHPTQMQGRIIVQGTGGPTPTPPDGVTGDANGDGMVNAIDAALVLQFVADFLASLPPSADANANGTIDAIDAALILQFVANLITQLPP